MRRVAVCIACAWVLASAWLGAEELPDQTIRIVVPVTAGSSLDARARVIADAVGQQIQRRVIVENRPGAGGTIGTVLVARAKPDGSTLLFTNNSHVISPHVYPDPGFDPIRDFVAVSRAYDAGMVLVAHPRLGVTTLSQLVMLARERPQPPSYASSGSGALPHLATELFKRAAGIDLLHVPYRGDGQALTDVLAGRVPLMMGGYVVAAPHIRAGKLRALAVTSHQRAQILGDVPTIGEAGYPGYAVDAWTGFFAPARTPVAVVERLNRAIAAALATAPVQAHLAATGAVSAAGTPGEFAWFVQQEWERYGKLVRELGLKAE
jgi:tripartite-type tricarboxylate transporter receptor subunit TctC